jgi:hypothetical protein
MSKSVAVISATGEVVAINVQADDYQTQPWEVEVAASAWVGGDYVESYFYAPQPFPSWTRKEGQWKPPVPMPADNSGYVWDEDSISWIEVEA